MYIQTWFIFIIVIVGYLYYRSKSRITRFCPFRITIFPKWYELLKDYKLVNDETWKQLDKEVANNKTIEYNVFLNGISFTVLKSNEQGDLIYNNNWKTFHSEVDFREELKIPNTDTPDFPFKTEFWVKHGIEGYEMGITTSESRKKIIISGDDAELVKVATIPYSLFYVPSKRFGVAKQNQIEKQLKENGWSKIKEHEEWKKDVLYRHIPDELEHKYFTLWYDYI